MKIAVSGKGGVGKTTLAASLIKGFAEANFNVLAIDADPDANLGMALGLEGAQELSPISSMKGLIYERTEATPGFGGLFRMNPKVDDLPEKVALKSGNIRLLVMGGVERGGSGCACPESVFLKALMNHIILGQRDVVVMDMEAGIEHLGRGTAKGVDRLIVVVEPGKRAVSTAFRIKELAKGIGIDKISLVGNKIRGAQDEEFLKESLKDFHFLGFIPYDEGLINADLKGGAPLALKEETKVSFLAISHFFLKS